MRHTLGASVDEQSALLEELFGDIGHLSELVRHFEYDLKERWWWERLELLVDKRSWEAEIGHPKCLPGERRGVLCVAPVLTISCQLRNIQHKPSLARSRGVTVPLSRRQLQPASPPSIVHHRLPPLISAIHLPNYTNVLTFPPESLINGFHQLDTVRASWRSTASSTIRSSR